MERPQNQPVYRFGLFELDVAAVELRRSGRRLPLQDLPFRLLVELLRHPGALVSREQLRQALWPEDIHVDFDGSLNAAIRRVREALGDSAKDPRYLETVPKRGYRFLAPVTREETREMDPASISAAQPIVEKPGGIPDVSPHSPPEPTPTTTPHSPSRRWWPLVAAAVGLVLWLWTARSAPPPKWPDQPRRLAILSLEAIGSDERLAPIAAGLTDEIIVHMGGLAPEHLRVVAPTSVRRAQADGDDIPAIARRLDVGYVLAGTLRVEENRLRVTARLIRAETESLMWATSLERRLGSLLDVERELASRLGEGLRRELLGGVTLPISPAAAISDAVNKVTAGSATPRRGTEPDAVAYEHFLRARHFLAMQTPESFAQAERELLQATERVPTYADAWAALAATRALLGIYDLERPRDVFPRAEKTLERALSLDPTNADALMTRAMIEASFHWRFDTAEADLLRVLELAPQNLPARRWLGLLYQVQGRDREAQAELAIARRLDPLSLTLRSTIAWCHFLAGRLDAAIAEAKAVLELDANYLVAWDDLKWFYTVAGRDAEAAEAFFKVVELEGHGDDVPDLRELYEEAGFRGLLQESLDNHLRSAGDEGYHSPYDIAIAAAAVGEVESALEWLGRSFEEREVDLLGLAWDPRLDPLRGEERFLDLLTRFRANP